MGQPNYLIIAMPITIWAIKTFEANAPYDFLYHQIGIGQKFPEAVFRRGEALAACATFIAAEETHPQNQNRPRTRSCKKISNLPPMTSSGSAGAEGSMDFSFGFGDANFSDRTLQLEIADDKPHTKSTASA